MLALLLAAAGEVFLDQATKQGMLGRRDGAEPDRPGWRPRLRVVWNRGGGARKAGRAADRLAAPGASQLAVARGDPEA
jgi:hypothetical protein